MFSKSYISGRPCRSRAKLFAIRTKSRYTYNTRRIKSIAHRMSSIRRTIPATNWLQYKICVPYENCMANLHYRYANGGSKMITVRGVAALHSGASKECRDGSSFQHLLGWPNVLARSPRLLCASSGGLQVYKRKVWSSRGLALQIYYSGY